MGLTGRGSIPLQRRRWDVGTLEGKVALITGGAGAIGLATARRFARDGATVVIADLDAGRLGAAQAVAQGDGVSLEAVALDVTSETDVEAKVGAIVDRHRRIDILFTSAGVLVSGSVLETSLADWQRTLAVNLTGSFLCARAVLPAMVAAGGGSIVLMSSVSGL